MTILVSSETRAKLDRLARDTQRSASHLAAEALESYVERETRAVAGIRRGLADLEQGRTLSHDQAMAELDALIDRIEAERGV